jgi:hypothetical protein
MRSYQQLVLRLQLQLKHPLQNQMPFRIVYKTIATIFEEKNDAKLNNKHNGHLIRKRVLPVPDCLDRYFAVNHWLPLVLQHPGFDLSSSPEDVAQINLVTSFADGWRFKRNVVRNKSGFPQCLDAVTNMAHNQHFS